MDRKFRPNWSVYDLAMKNEDEWFIENAKRILEGMPNPWEKPKRGRPYDHPPKSLVIAILLKIEQKKTYREDESYLRTNGLYKKLGFRTPPTKSTLHRAMERIPQGYIDELDRELKELLKKRGPPSRRLHRIWNQQIRILV